MILSFLFSNLIYFQIFQKIIQKIWIKLKLWNSKKKILSNFFEFVENIWIFYSNYLISKKKTFVFLFWKLNLKNLNVFRFIKLFKILIF